MLGDAKGPEVKKSSNKGGDFRSEGLRVQTWIAITENLASLPRSLLRLRPVNGRQPRALVPHRRTMKQTKNIFKVQDKY